MLLVGQQGLSVDSLVEINRIANRDLIFANNKLYFSEEAFLKDGNTEVKDSECRLIILVAVSYEVETKTDTVTGEQTTTVKQTTPVAVGNTSSISTKIRTLSLSCAKSRNKVETSNTHHWALQSSADSGASSPVNDNAPSNTGTTNQPVASNLSSEVPAPKVGRTSDPRLKAEEPATQRRKKTSDTDTERREASNTSAEKRSQRHRPSGRASDTSAEKRSQRHRRRKKRSQRHRRRKKRSQRLQHQTDSGRTNENSSAKSEESKK